MPVFKINVEKHMKGVILLDLPTKEEASKYVKERISDELEIQWVADQIDIHSGVNMIEEVGSAPTKEDMAENGGLGDDTRT